MQAGGDPGATELHVIPRKPLRGEYASAIPRVSPSTPLLAAAYGTELDRRAAREWAGGGGQGAAGEGAVLAKVAALPKVAALWEYLHGLQRRDVDDPPATAARAARVSAAAAPRSGCARCGRLQETWDSSGLTPPPLPTVAPTHVPIVHSLDPRDETGSPGRRRARHPYSSRCIPGAAARARKKGALSIVSSVTLQSSSDLIWRVGPPAGERRVAGERMCGLEGGGGGCPISTRGVSD